MTITPLKISGLQGVNDYGIGRYAAGVSITGDEFFDVIQLIPSQIPAIAKMICETGTLPPREEVNTYMIAKFLGSCGTIDTEECATIAGKILWQKGKRATKSLAYYDTMLEDAIYNYKPEPVFAIDYVVPTEEEKNAKQNAETSQADGSL